MYRATRSTTGRSSASGGTSTSSSSSRRSEPSNVRRSVSPKGRPPSMPHTNSTSTINSNQMAHPISQQKSFPSNNIQGNNNDNSNSNIPNDTPEPFNNLPNRPSTGSFIHVQPDPDSDAASTIGNPPLIEIITQQLYTHCAC